MRRRRLITALMAVVLAAVGITLLTDYVRGADRRALDGLDTVNVLVVTKPVTQGAEADTLSGSVTSKPLPRLAVAPGALASLQEAAGRVTASALQPGEQLLDSKFVAPAPPEENPDEVPLPPGLQEVTVSLERQRMLGSKLTAGTRVGVFVSLPAEGETPARTKLAVAKVLVLAVGDPSSERTSAPGGADAELGEVAEAPAESLTVRLAVGTRDVEKVVFGAEFGRLWLSRQPDDVPSAEPGVMTAKEVYQ